MPAPDPNVRSGEREVARHLLALRPVPCRSCGAPMVFLETEAGKRMPMSLRTDRATPCPDCAGVGRCQRCSSSGQVHLLLAHFTDCPNARDFRKKRPKAE